MKNVALSRLFWYTEKTVRNKEISMKIIELKETVTASNDRDAAVLRSELKEKGTLLINLMASPGAANN